MHTEFNFENAWNEFLGSTLYPSTLYLLYDGDCLLCQNAAWYFRLRKAAGELHLINLREHLSLAGWLKSVGLNVNEGVLVLHRGDKFFGAAALSYLNTLGNLDLPGGVFAARLLRNRLFSNLLYPLLRMARNILNWIRGVGKL